MAVAVAEAAAEAEVANEAAASAAPTTTKRKDLRMIELVPSKIADSAGGAVPEWLATPHSLRPM